MSSPIPAEVANAILLLDSESASWPEATRHAWRKVRGFARARHKDSQRSLPAMSIAAQEVIQVRDHAQAALDAMEGVFGRTPDDEPDTARHTRPPDDAEPDGKP